MFGRIKTPDTSATSKKSEISESKENTSLGELEARADFERKFKESQNAKNNSPRSLLADLTLTELENDPYYKQIEEDLEIHRLREEKRQEKRVLNFLSKQGSNEQFQEKIDIAEAKAQYSRTLRFVSQMISQVKKEDEQANKKAEHAKQAAEYSNRQEQLDNEEGTEKLLYRKPR